MPKDRPKTITCFLERDADFEQEVVALGQAIIVWATDWEGDLMADQVVDFAVATEKVEAGELSVATLNGSTCLIHLPPTLAPATFIEAIPARIWNLGLEFQPWSLYAEAEKIIPEFKVLIDLASFPIHLWRERDVIRAVSNFGIYLGTVSPPHSVNYMAWSVAIATDKLERIPKFIETFIGGFKSRIRVLPLKWIQAPIYKDEDCTT